MKQSAMKRSPIAGFMAGTIVIAGGTPAVGQQMCMPNLAFKEVRFSAMKPPTLQRKWTAVVSVDASHCAANTGGRFDIVFTRLKEIGPDLEFREQFMWQTEPIVSVAVYFSADEAVARYRIDNITPCPCRR